MSGMLFETIVCLETPGAESKFGDVQIRYATWREAMDTHENLAEPIGKLIEGKLGREALRLADAFLGDYEIAGDNEQ